MKGRPRGRKGDLEARREWTARLNRFAEAKTTKQKQAAFDASSKINPGGTLRDMLNAWGYSASARGRKPKDAGNTEPGKTARDRLKLALDELFGVTPTPVPSLYAKLAGRTDITVKDASRIIAALVVAWPENLKILDSTKGPENVGEIALHFAESLIKELLSELSAGRSSHWSSKDMEIRVFRLVDEERVRVSQFIRDAGEKEGALIVAGARNILIGPNPVDIIRQFHKVTIEFIGEDNKGILIFVFDAAIFEAGKEGFNLLYNFGLLSTAMTAFALFPENYDYKNPIQQHKVNWSRWRSLSRRCCVVIRKPPLVDPSSGEFLKRDRFDEFIASWRTEENFARLRDLRGFVRFDSGHVLPRTYPTGFGDAEALANSDFYWDVLVRPARDEPDGLEVQYLIPPPESVGSTTRAQDKLKEELNSSQMPRSGRGRPASKTLPIEEELYYVTKRGSPGPHYDDAQRTIYMAARGRLNLDAGQRHTRNLNAAAALRQLGYEVLPISVMLSLFPRSLHFAAAKKLDTTTNPRSTKKNAVSLKMRR